MSSPAAQPAADARLTVTDAGGDEIAACSLWWRRTPSRDGHRVGFIGNYVARDGAGGARLLELACERLREQGATLAVGPVDGSTWLSYRCVTQRGDDAPFFLEPWTPAEWPAHFCAASFSPRLHYRSAVQEDLDIEGAWVGRALARVQRAGVRIRAFDPRRAEAELRRIHALSLHCFSAAPFYTPLDVDSFLTLYRPMLDRMDPDLVTLAECEGDLVGFLFSLPDALQAARNGSIDTVIVKTVAVSSGRRHAGLGHLLAASAAPRARALGYRRAIHALMHDDNGSANWSARLGRTFRRYALYTRPLHREGVDAGLACAGHAPSARALTRNPRAASRCQVGSR